MKSWFHWTDFYRESDYIKKKIISCGMILAILLLVGCGQISTENKTEMKIEDVIVTNPDTTYYTKQDNTLYPCDDAILICGYNEYRCINTSMEYDKESGKYICVIEFKKIIE